MSRSFRSLVTLTAVLALALAWPAAPLLAQSSAGSISGTVADAAGGPLPGASVIAKNAKTGATRTTLSNASGAFTFPLLAVGVYSVTADLSGFSSATKSGVELNVGGDVTLKFVLALSSVTTAVTVTEEAPLIETTRTQQSDVVNENYIANLPTNGRNFIDFVLTTPGVTKDAAAGRKVDQRPLGKWSTPGGLKSKRESLVAVVVFFFLLLFLFVNSCADVEFGRPVALVVVGPDEL